ncbi:MAG: hypothetical protein H7Y86_08525 [Rhizobacter sp.]|nr:hypothetical protein [Ferruginibacter sp.]
MKTRFLTFILMLLFFGCKKSDTADTGDATITLNNLQTLKDTATLTWSASGNAGFTSFSVVRRAGPINFSDTILRRRDPQFLQFRDTRVPYNSSVEYQVFGTLSSGTIVGSNIVKYERPEIKFVDVIPFDVRFDSTNRLLYFFEQTGGITIYSLQNSQVTKQINIASKFGYCDLGTYNGIKELYVPGKDGQLYIYNAQTLELIDQLNIGFSLHCVVFNNDVLYVSSGSLQKPIQAYSRGTKNLISASVVQTAGLRFKKIPNSATELIGISELYAPTAHHYYSFESNGNFLMYKHGIDPGYSLLDPGIFEVFPSGGKYISAFKGGIYNKDLLYLGRLPFYNSLPEYRGYYVDDVRQQIFCATTSKTIEVYSVLDYSHIRTLTSDLYPYYIFKDGTNYISVNTRRVVSLDYAFAERVYIESFQ